VKEKEALEARAASNFERAVDFIIEKAVDIYGGSKAQ
jgi:hypothetical protein